MRKVIGIFYTFVFIFSFFPNNVAAQQIEINPALAGDAFVESAHPSTLQGGSSNSVFGYINGNTLKMFVKFNIPTIPSNATINSAYLFLYRKECVDSPNPTTFTIAQVGGSWSESSINWNNKPADTTTTMGHNSSCGTPGDYTSYDIKAIAESWKAGTTNNGVSIYGPQNRSWYRSFYTKEADSSKAPKLRIYYTIPDGTSGSGNANSTSGTSFQSNTGIVNQAAPTASSNQQAAPVDATVPAPKFYQLRDDGRVVTVSDGKGEVNGKHSFIIGSATPGYKVLVFTEGKTYESTSNSLGYWAVNIDTTTWAEGIHKVEAQAINSAGKGSQVVTLINLDKVDLANVARRLSAGARGMDWLDKLMVSWFYFGPIFSLLFWIVVILLIIFFIKRHRKKKKEEESKKRIGCTSGGA